MEETTTLETGTVETQGQATNETNTDYEKRLQEEEAKYKALQSDYTKKAQELSELKKSQQTVTYDDDDGAEQARRFVDSILDEYWLKELPTTIKQKQNDETFERLVGYEPALREQEQAIKELAAAKWLSIEDTIKNYNFLSSDKLEKARNARPIVGNPSYQEKKEKSIAEMSPQEREAHKAKIKGR